MKTHAAIAVLTCSAGMAMAQSWEWSNIRSFPADFQATGDGWSAVRSELPFWESHRCAADDFVLTEDVRITSITYWSVHINDPVVIAGGDWYVYQDAGGVPGALLHQGGSSTLEHTPMGLSHPQWGLMYENTIRLDLSLPPGHYWLGLRTYQELQDPNITGKRNNIMATTRWRHPLGVHPAQWSFNVRGDGQVWESWVPMRTFNLVSEQEWAFRMDGQTTAGCYADCDSSTGQGVLDIFDFLCFQNRFASSSTYACDCDTATGPGVCDIFDFLCFQNAFAAGCP